MEVFITILSTVVVQLGICIFCFFKKQSQVSSPFVEAAS
jgi:hypothetical protein